MGFGLSMAVFQFPGALDRTPPGQFPQRFGGPLKVAVIFLTVWTTLMLVGGLIMTIAEWDQGDYRWAPLVYFVATVVATTITLGLIFPVNKVLNTPTDDAAMFRLDPVEVDQAQPCPHRGVDDRVAGHGPVVRGHGHEGPLMMSVEDLQADPQRGLAVVVGIFTAASGLFVLTFPKTSLSLLGANDPDPAPYLFGLVGMFMLLFGGLLIDAARRQEPAAGCPVLVPPPEGRRGHRHAHRRLHRRVRLVRRRGGAVRRRLRARDPCPLAARGFPARSMT